MLGGPAEGGLREGGPAEGSGGGTQHENRLPKMDWPKLAGETGWPKMDWPKIALFALQRIAPFARTRTTTDRQTSLLAGSDKHVLVVLREEYPRVRSHHTPHPTVARRTVGGSVTLCRTRCKSP